MVKKHMTKCSPSLVIKEMEIKTTLRFHLTPVRIAIIKKHHQQQVLVRMQGKWNPHTLLVGMQASTTTSTIWRLLKKLNIHLPYDPAIPLLGTYPKECDTGYSIGTRTPMFIAALFTIAKLWKQPRFPTTDEWIKKMWYLYTIELKKNEILSFASKWMELENIILCEVSQDQKAKNHMFSLIYGF
jgi:hypothetical protein